MEDDAISLVDLHDLVDWGTRGRSMRRPVHAVNAGTKRLQGSACRLLSWSVAHLASRELRGQRRKLRDNSANPVSSSRRENAFCQVDKELTVTEERFMERYTFGQGRIACPCNKQPVYHRLRILLYTRKDKLSYGCRLFGNGRWTTGKLRACSGR